MSRVSLASLTCSSVQTDVLSCRPQTVFCKDGEWLARKCSTFVTNRDYFTTRKFGKQYIDEHVTDMMCERSVVWGMTNKMVFSHQMINKVCHHYIRNVISLSPLTSPLLFDISSLSYHSLDCTHIKFISIHCENTFCFFNV